MAIEHILVTKLVNHWDRVPDNRTTYKLNLLPNRNFEKYLSEVNKAIFIKLENNSQNDVACLILMGSQQIIKKIS